MAAYAFRDGSDGYYQIEVPEGQPLPDWVSGLTPTPVVIRPSEAHDYVDGNWVLNPAKFNAIIEGQMDALEKNEITPRSAREFQLQVTPLILKLVAPWAASFTFEQIVTELLNPLGDNYAPGYLRMFLFDQQIAALRRERK